MTFKGLSKQVSEKTKWSAATFSRSIKFSLYLIREVFIFSALVEALIYPLLTISNSTVTPQIAPLLWLPLLLNSYPSLSSFLLPLCLSVNNPLLLSSILLCIYTNYSTIFFTNLMWIQQSPPCPTSVRFITSQLPSISVSSFLLFAQAFNNPLPLSSILLCIYT